MRAWPSELRRGLGWPLCVLAKGLAVGRGRDFVSPDDVQVVAGPALAHRLVLAPEAALYGIQATDIVDEALRTVPLVVDRPSDHPS